MAWIFGSVVFLTAVWLMVAFPVARKVALALVVVSALAGAAIYARGKQRETKALAAITPDQLEIADLRLSEPHGIVKLHGTLRNRSSAPMADLKLYITIEECRADKCEIVDDADVLIYERVPAGQTRRFDSYPSLDLPQGDNWSWSYVVREIRADLP